MTFTEGNYRLLASEGKKCVDRLDLLKVVPSDSGQKINDKNNARRRIWKCKMQ